MLEELSHFVTEIKSQNNKGQNKTDIMTNKM